MIRLAYSNISGTCRRFSRRSCGSQLSNKRATAKLAGALGLAKDRLAGTAGWRCTSRDTRHGRRKQKHSGAVTLEGAAQYHGRARQADLRRALAGGEGGDGTPADNAAVEAQKEAEMREDHLEALEKMFPDGFVLVYTQRQGTSDLIDLRCQVRGKTNNVGKRLEEIHEAVLDYCTKTDKME